MAVMAAKHLITATGMGTHGVVNVRGEYLGREWQKAR